MDLRYPIGAFAFEGPLTSLLAEVFPDHTAELLAFDADRSWMLTRDAGTRLRELFPDRAQLDEWERLLPRYAELQQRLAPRADELLGLGVTDLRLEALPSLLTRAAGDTEVLTRDDEDGMSAAERQALVDGVGAFAELWRKAA